MSDWRDNPNQRILLDNGAHTIRIGLPSYPSKSIIKIPNAKGTTYIYKYIYIYIYSARQEYKRSILRGANGELCRA